MCLYVVRDWRCLSADECSQESSHLSWPWENGDAAQLAKDGRQRGLWRVLRVELVWLLAGRFDAGAANDRAHSLTAQEKTALMSAVFGELRAKQVC